MTLLSNTPDWHAAGQELVTQCASLDDLEDRVRLLEKLCNGLGNNLYPAFLHLLCVIEQCGDHESQHLLTGTLVFGLTTDRLPSGRLPAWGATHSTEQNPFSQARTLGPIEFLCAWYTQPTNLPSLDTRAFRTCMDSVLKLLSSNEEAKHRYCNKLLRDAGDPLSGSLSGSTRSGLEALAAAWLERHTTEELSAIYLEASRPSSLLDQLNATHGFQRS